MNETNPTPASEGGSKLSTIFLIVLGLHILLIVAFSAYYLLKGDTSVETETPEVTQTETTEPSTPPVSPVLETARDTEMPVNEPASESEAPILPMPPSSDPIWNQAAAPVVPPAQPAPPAITRVEPVPTPTSPRQEATIPTASSPRSHTVVKGDTLGRIARTYNVTVADLKKANQLSNDMIRVGQTLVIPGTGDARPAPAPVVTRAPAPAAVPVNDPAATPASATGSYTVAKGDTLWSIARRLGVSPQELAKLNGIQDPSRLKIGTVLRVPGTPERQDMATPPRAVPATVPTDMAMAPGQSENR